MACEAYPTENSTKRIGFVSQFFSCFHTQSLQAQSKYLSVIFFLHSFFFWMIQAKQNETKQSTNLNIFVWLIYVLSHTKRAVLKTVSIQKATSKSKFAKNSRLWKWNHPKNIPICHIESILFPGASRYMCMCFGFIFIYFIKSLLVISPRAPFTSPHLLPFFLYTSFGHSPLSPVQYSGISQSFLASRHTAPCSRSCK